MILKKTDSLPPGWVRVNLRDLGKWSSGGTPSRKRPEFFNGNIPWVKSGDLPDGDIIATEEKINEMGVANSAAKILPTGAILIALYGATIGKLGVLTFPAATNQACAACEVNSRLIEQKFLFLFLLSQREQLIAAGQGGAQPNLTNEIVRRWSMALPPLAEQRRIVGKVEAVLARVNAARDRLAKVSTLLKRFRQSTLAAACSGKLTANWREENGHEVEWPSVKLGAIGEVSGGITKNATRASLPRQVSYLRVANVYQNRLELGEVLKIGVTDAEFKRTVLKTGDLLFVEGNGSVDQIGRVARWDGSVSGCVHQNHLIRFRAPAILDSKFVLLAMMSPPGREQLMNHAISSAGLHSLSISKIAACDLPLPQLAEQHEVVRRVEALFALADTIEARVAAASARADKLIQSTLAKAFRGELVPTEHALQHAAVASAQKIDEGLAVLYALALLYTWKASPDRRAFELGMILMQKDELRQRILKGVSAMPPLNAPRPSHSPSVGRIDEFIGELVGTNTIGVTNRQTRQLIALGTNAPAKAGLVKDSIGKKAFMMADEAVRAVAALDQLGQSLDQYSTADDYDTIEIAISGV